MESSLYQAITCLDKVRSSFHREILVIQSSPMTKDQYSLQETVDVLRVGEVSLNVVSMCGWTEAIKVNLLRLRGRSNN